MKDSEFIRKDKVPMTKHEIRAVSLSYLDINMRKRFLDVGAGSGSCFLEALVTNENLTATAIESDEDAIDLIRQNIDKFNEKYKNIKNRTTLIHGKAPLDIDGKFDAIFVGGTRGNIREIIAHCLLLLEKGGAMVINLITLENFSLAMQILQEENIQDVTGCQLSVNKIENLGRYKYLKPQNPIFIIKIQS